MPRRFTQLVAWCIWASLSAPAWAVVMEAPKSLPPAPVQAAAPADRAYAQALGLFAKGDLAGAKKGFQQALTLQANHVPALLGLAEVAFQQKQPQQAAKYLQQAVEAGPNDAHAQASWGRYLAVNKRYPEAETALQRAIALDAAMVRPRMDLADLYATALKQPAKAVALYQEVLRIDAGHAGAHYALGVALARQGEADKARTSLERSAELAPDNPLPALALAQLAAGRKSLDDALRWVNQALKLQPTLAAALELRGDLHDARSNARQALADYQAAVQAAPALASAHFKLGSLFQRQNQVREAMRAYQAAIQAAPGFAAAYNNLAWLAAENRLDLDQAETWARQAVKLEPKAAAYLDTLGWVLRARGQLGEAEKTLRESLRLSRQADTLYRLGVVLQEAGKPAEAEKAFKDALALAPGHAAAKTALAGLKR
jgi:tetratricopeptide (TPR) repeat protein